MEKQDKRIIAEYFSKKWKFWQDIYKDDKNLQNLLYQISIRKDLILKIIDEIPRSRPLKILDIGSGPGVLMKNLAEKGHHTVGIDISWQMIKAAKETSTKPFSGKNDCIQGDIEALPFVNESFDVIVCAGVLSYLTSEKKSIIEMSRVVKPFGIILVTLPNIFRINNILDPYYYLLRGAKFLKLKISSNLKSDPIPSTIGKNNSFQIRKYLYSKLNELFIIKGLDINKIVSLGFGPLTFWRKKIFPLNWSIKLSYYFENLANKKKFRFLAFFANHWIIYLNKRK